MMSQTNTFSYGARRLLYACAVTVICITAWSCGTSNTDDKSGALAGDCHTFSEDECPTDRCVALEVTDLSHDLDAAEPTCKGAQTTLCVADDQQTGSAVLAVRYREEGTPRAVLLGGDFALDGWQGCPSFEEALTGDEPAVCSCAFPD